jgi:hypothetical protein
MCCSSTSFLGEPSYYDALIFAASDPLLDETETIKVISLLQQLSGSPTDALDVLEAVLSCTRCGLPYCCCYRHRI